MKLGLINKLAGQKILLKFLSSSFLSIPVSLIVSFVSLKTIDPYFMGLWASLSIIEVYSTIFRFGIVNGMNRELPYSFGSGNKEKAFEIAETTLFFTIATSAIFLLITPFFFTLIRGNPIEIFALIVIIIQIISNQYATYLTGTYRTSSNFNRLSDIQFITLVLKILSIPLLIYYSFLGFIIMHLIISVLHVSLLNFFKPLLIKPKFNKNRFIELFKIGFPIFLSSYAIGFIDTIPKLFILNFGSVELLGFYTPVIALLSVFSALPNSLGAYFAPKLTYNLALKQNPKILRLTILKIYGVSVLILIPITLIIFFILDYFDDIFPKYKSSIPYLYLALFASPFVIARLGNMISIILKHYNYILFFVLFYGLFQVGYLFILFSFFSNDILWCATVSQALTLASLLITSIILNNLSIKSSH